MPQVQLTPPTLPANVCYANEQARANDYFGRASVGLPDGYTTVKVATTAPGPSDRDKIWIRTDNNGRILGTYLFSNGQWQTINPTTPYLVPGEFRYYDPGLYTPVAPWFPCDGTITSATPAVPDLRGTHFIARGQRVLPSGSTDQATNFIAGQAGGRENQIATAENIPAHLHTALGFLGGGGFNPSNPGVILNPVATNLTKLNNAITNGNTTGFMPDGVTPAPPVPMVILEPYYVVAVMQWRPDLA